MWLALLAAVVTPAHAGWPTRVADRIPVDPDAEGNPQGGQVERMAASLDGTVVVGRVRNTGIGWAMDIEDWSVAKTSDSSTSTGCGESAVAGAAVVDLSNASYDIWLACEDGFVTLWEYDTDDVVMASDDQGAISIDITGGNPLVGAWFDPFTLNVVFVDQADSTLGVYTYDAYGDGNITVLSELIYDGFREALLKQDASSSTLYISHGGERMSHVNISTGITGLFSNQLGLNYSVDDVAPSVNGVYGIDQATNSVIEYTTGGGVGNLLTTVPDISPTVIVASVVPNDEWVMVSGDGGVRIFSATDGILGGVVFEALDADIYVEDAIALGDYTVGGGEGGNVVVMSNGPWVTLDGGGQAVLEGEQVEFSFSVDQDSTVRMYLNGDRTGSGGTLLDTRTVTADESVAVSVIVDDAWTEGRNRIYVVAEDGDGNIGHSSAVFYVDNPPAAPQLVKPSSADQRLILEFDGISDADLDYYEIYVSTSDLSEYAGGADAPSTDLLLNNQIRTVTASGGESVYLELEGLRNGKTYYFGVRAIDAGGLESVMSNVVSGTPVDTLSAGDLAGETGGVACNSAGLGASGWLAGLAGLIALGRRKRLATAVAATMLATTASAADDDDKSDRGDMTKQTANFEIRYGTINLDDEYIDAVYNRNAHNMLQLELGPQITRFFEVDLEFGFFQELSNKQTDSGTSTADKTMLTMWPLGIGGSARLHIVDEQIVVPYAKYGFDYVIFAEKYDDPAGKNGKSSLNGAKMGNHFALGAGLLLDPFQRSRANLLEAQSGINDTYLTFEWRKQRIDNRERPWASAPSTVEGFNFSGSLFTVGLKLDY